MNKPSLSRTLILAGVLAAAGAAAQAETSDVPVSAGEYSTITNGVPNAFTTNSPYTDQGVLVIDTNRMGAGPAVVTTPGTTTWTTTTYYYPSSSYVISSPAWVGGTHGYASATTPVPDRAGEASTFLNGQPNMLAY